MNIEERLAEIERRLDAIDEKNKVEISVHVNGGSGYNHIIRKLAREGAASVMCEYDSRRG